jgi:hypothetical protein
VLPTGNSGDSDNNGSACDQYPSGYDNFAISDLFIALWQEHDLA